MQPLTVESGFIKPTQCQWCTAGRTMVGVGRVQSHRVSPCKGTHEKWFERRLDGYSSLLKYQLYNNNINTAHDQS